jgi:hypothetical protein
MLYLQHVANILAEKVGYIAAVMSVTNYASLRNH